MNARLWCDDLRLTLRSVARAKTFYATAVLTLAVGMAGATVMFTLIRGILLRPLPVPDEEHLVVSWRVPPAGPAIHVPYRAADIDRIARDSRAFERVAGVGYNGAWEETWQEGPRQFTASTAVVMGETTFGKGTVQEIYPLGKRGAKVTVSRFYLPGGRSTQRQCAELSCRRSRRAARARTRRRRVHPPHRAE